ncbi:hypothetical protein [Methylobacter marinus]|uniref:hypothetical protein n=1 Tax=Methylobacter marinus TaxID=34058 RepID=UPI00037B21FF|nr:hypothetical protein [Methylobacter marinus]
MSLEPITALRTRLRANAALQDFWNTHYEKDARHFVGYKSAPSANDYPSICYVPVTDLLSHKGDDGFWVSVVVGVHEPGTTDDWFDGVTRLLEARDLIMAALSSLILAPGLTVDGSQKIKIVYDFGRRHPFYEMEMQIPIKQHNRID